jgi:hypothetical protein
MSILSQLFRGGKDPSKAAQPYLNQIPGVGHQYYDPYITAGQNAGNRTQTEYEGLINDPVALINKIMEQYKTSDAYGFKKDQLLRQMGATSAAGGFAGTKDDQLAQAEGVQGLLSQDMEEFLAHALGLYGTGLQGEEGIANRGFESSKNLADLLGGALNQQAGLAFQGQQQKNANKQSIFSSLAKALGQGAGAIYNGGMPGPTTAGYGGG